jgi:hypothetical protein
VAAIMAEDKISREIVEALSDAPEAPGSTGAPA